MHERKLVRNAVRGDLGNRRTIIATVALLMAVGLVTDSVRLPHIVNPSLRGGVEMAVILMLVLSAWMLRAAYRITDSLDERLIFTAVVGALLADLVCWAVPTFAGIAPLALGSGPLVVSILVSTGFAVVALVTSGAAAGRAGRMSLRVGLAVVGGLIAADAIAHLNPTPTPLIPSFHGASAALVALVSGSLLALAGAAFARCVTVRSRDARRFAVVAFGLAGVQLQFLLLPATPAGWVTPTEALRLGAYGLLLAFATRSYNRTQRSTSRAMVVAERLRIAGDLHDGIAQDLAFIAAFGDRMARDLGDVHPVAVAAQRALAVSRGVIVDLAASDEGTALDALHVIADEIQSRYDVQITVSQIDASVDAGSELRLADRHEVVRIAREAIINAVRHGRAQHVAVSLGSRGRGRFLLRVTDDGCGIQIPPSPTGLGLRAMKERCRQLDGQLFARRRRGGGTEVEVRTP